MVMCKGTRSLSQEASSYDNRAGLDEAILGAMNPTDPEEDTKKIASLLQNGAHAMLAQEETKAQDGQAFAEEVNTPSTRPCIRAFSEGVTMPPS